MNEVYRFRFAPAVPAEEIQGSLLLSLFAVESLHGAALVCLEAKHTVDALQRTCTLDAATPVGRDLVRIFTGFIAREYGAESFSVERLVITNASKEVSA